MVPRHPPHLEYITSIESMCPRLSQQDVEEFRANLNRVLRGSHQPPKSNLNRAELQAIRELKRDKPRIVLMADKGVAMVVMNREEYINKPNTLLAQPAYRPICKHPTNKIKAKLIYIFKKVKKETGLDDNSYKYMYPARCNVPKFNGLPKIHKPDTPLRPIMSSRILVT